MNKRFISVLLCLCIVFSLASTCAFASEFRTGDVRAVIGADLTPEQKAQIYNYFGIKEGSVTELSMTNAEEHQALDSFVDPALIGTNSLSCVYVEKLAEGEGLQIATYNINWCTEEMYLNALVTAGVEDVKVIVAAPFQVSGTAALAGIYKAYENMTGESIDDLSKLISTQELVITGELADEIGSYDASEIVSEMKLILDETVSMTDEELTQQIREISAEVGVSLTDSQIKQLIDLCRSLEKLDTDQLKEKVIYVQETVKKLSEAREKVTTITEKIQTIVTGIQSIIDKISSIFTMFG